MVFLSLAVPSPLRKTFDYLPPDHMSESEARALLPGIRIKAQFGRQRVIASLIAVKDHSDVDSAKLRPIEEIIDTQPLLPASIIDLCQWSARYYQHPIGDVYQHAFPKELRQGKPPYSSKQTAWELTTEGKGLPKGALSRAPKQAQALALLQEHPQVDQQLLEQQEISPATVRTLVNKNLAIKTTKRHSHFGTQLEREHLTLNQEQQQALEAITATLGQHQSHLLEGITGSGKTEVYLQAIDHCIKSGKQALVLIPEIGLTPQTLARFNQRFGSAVAVFHSNLSESEKTITWEAARKGEASIILGTRSAIFTPLQNPGLIIVDEEHDASYKQQEGFRYNARDIAIKRAQLESTPIVLGSATPSLESLHNMDAGRFQYLQLKQRAGNAKPPHFKCVDIRKAPLDNGLSPELLSRIKDHLKQQSQVLVFINRRGYAPTLQCHDCGWIAECRHCDTRLTVHKDANQLRCHFCDYTTSLHHHCPECRSPNLLDKGIGSQRCEQALNRLFPDYPVFRIDRDATQRKNAMSELLDNIHNSGPSILVGTQMLAKGHHFPDVTLVAILDADAGLFSADFRSEERMGQLLTQVAGRSGRAEKPGEVLIQTHYPQHPLLLTLLEQGYGVYARQLLAERQAAQLPPQGYLGLVRADHKNPQAAENFLLQIRQQLEASGLTAQAQCYGPLPSPKPRRAGNYHMQLLLSSQERKALHQALAFIIHTAEQLPNRQKPRWSVDIDPQDLM